MFTVSCGDVDFQKTLTEKERDYIHKGDNWISKLGREITLKEIHSMGWTLDEVEELPKKKQNEFWKEASKIKSELGDKGYYLDRYLSVIFETIADLDLGTASVVADNLCSDIFRDCCIVCCGDDALIKGKEKSEFFEIVKNYIDSHL